ncbi:MAG: transposase [Mycobacterium sp.]
MGFDLVIGSLSVGNVGLQCGEWCRWWGLVCGIDRGVAVSVALSTGELLHAPHLSRGEAKRLRVLQQRLARAQRGSSRRAGTKRAIAKLKAREADRRKDWVEKATTDIARRFDTIRIEALDVPAMTRSARGTLEQPGVGVAQKRALNRAISRSGWGLFARNIAAGRAVTARGDLAAGRSANREPQLANPAA